MYDFDDIKSSEGFTTASFPEKFVESSASSVPSTPEPVGLDCTLVSPDIESGRESPVDVSSTSESGASHSVANGRRSPTASRNPLLQERWTSEELRAVSCHLETKDLWEKFNELGTEMIITKTG
ncbi:T-box domain containing protein, partial [Asbolus verrucosus]